MSIDTPPKDDEVLVIDVVNIVGNTVVLDVRIRTDENWRYYRKWKAQVGTTLRMRDNQPRESVSGPILIDEKVPRNE
jgi:hypothetical protein